MSQSQLWVEVVGSLIMIRVRGDMNEDILRESQDQMVQLVKDTGINRVLYDTLEMNPPPPNITFVQQTLDQALGDLQIRRALVVPNSKLAYLARIAFAEGDYRVFYNDLGAAIAWLNQEPP